MERLDPTDGSLFKGHDDSTGMSPCPWTGKTAPTILFWVIVVVALTATLAISFFIFTWTLFGLRDPRLVANGIISATLFVFVFSLVVFYRNDPAHFLDKGVVRTSIAISFTVAYVLLLAYSFISTDLGLDFKDNKFLDNFYLVYISIIGFYFTTAAIERFA